jgi:hypothetical protein
VRSLLPLELIEIWGENVPAVVGVPYTLGGAPGVGGPKVNPGGKPLEEKEDPDGSGEGNEVIGALYGES